MIETQYRALQRMYTHMAREVEDGAQNLATFRSEMFDVDYDDPEPQRSSVPLEDVDKSLALLENVTQVNHFFVPNVIS